jgi:hypothetical protein
MEARTRRLLVAALVIIGAIHIVLFVGALLYPTVDQALHAQRFEAGAWRSTADHLSTAWPIRLRMVDDLTTHRQLIGLTRDDLVVLLGPPDDVRAFRERSRRADDDAWDVGYELGPQRGPIIRIDNDWLLFDLDRNGKVQRFIVTHD